MKLLINQNSAIEDTEVIINCPAIDSGIKTLVDYIRQQAASVMGYIDDAAYYISINNILYLESIDKRTYFYDTSRVFRSRCSLTEIERSIGSPFWVRISRSCIVNMIYIESYSLEAEHRLEVVLLNGERLTATRHYRDGFLTSYAEYKRNGRGVDFGSIWTEKWAEKSHSSVMTDGKILEFTAVPERVVVISYGIAEIMVTLGLSKHILAIACPADEIEHTEENCREELRKIPTINCSDYGVPMPEDLRRLEPDLVLSTYYFRLFLERGNIEFSDIPIYYFECSMPGKATMEAMHRDVLNLGRLFQITGEAISLVERRREKMSRILSLRPNSRSLKRVFVYDSREHEPYTSFRDTLESHLILLAGGKNIFFDHPGMYGRVTWEDVQKRNPQYIILHDFADYMSLDEKIRYLKENKLMAGTDAVRYNRFIPLCLAEIFPGMQVEMAVKKLMMAMYPEAF